MFRSRTAIVAAALSLTAALVRAEPYNITLTDVSPTIRYLPSRDGDSAQTWNTSYTISGQYNSQPGSIGQGESLHYTSADGASASVGFVGTAVYVYGYNYGLDTDVRLAIGEQELDTDGATDGFLGKKEGLKNQWWELTINKTAGGGERNGFDLRRIIVTVDFGGTGATFENTTLSTLDENDNPNSQISFSGSWTTGTEAGLVQELYTRVDTYGQDARIFIPTLSGKSLAIVYGSVNEDHAGYAFWPSEPAPGWPSSQYFNGSSPWIAINQVIWFGIVEGGQIVGQNLNGSYWFDVSRIDFITASGGKEGSGVNAGAIAGGVVGGIAALVLVLLGLWLLRRRRQQKQPMRYKSGRSDSDGFEIDPYKEVGNAEADGQAGLGEEIEMTYAGRPTTEGAETMAEARSPGHSPTVTHSQSTASGSATAIPLLPAVASPSTTTQQERPTRLALVSPEPGTEHPLETPSQPTPADSERKSRRQQRSAAQQAGFVQETDAGRVALLPPSYDPAWAQEGLAEHDASQSPTSEVDSPRAETSRSQTAPSPEHTGEIENEASAEASEAAESTHTHHTSGSGSGGAGKRRAGLATPL